MENLCSTQLKSRSKSIKAFVFLLWINCVSLEIVFLLFCLKSDSTTFIKMLIKCIFQKDFISAFLEFRESNGSWIFNLVSSFHSFPKWTRQHFHNLVSGFHFKTFTNRISLNVIWYDRVIKRFGLPKSE